MPKLDKALKILKAQLTDAEREAERLRMAIAVLAEGRRGPGRPPGRGRRRGPGRPRKRKFSRAVRRKMAAAQRRRWAKVKAKGTPKKKGPGKKPTVKPKPEARAAAATGKSSAPVTSR